MLALKYLITGVGQTQWAGGVVHFWPLKGLACNVIGRVVICFPKSRNPLGYV